MRDCLRDAPQDFCPDLRRRLLAQQVAIARQIIELQQSGDLLTALLEK